MRSELDRIAYNQDAAEMGRFTFRNCGVSVERILGNLIIGIPQDQVLADYSQLDKEDLDQARLLFLRALAAYHPSPEEWQEAGMPGGDGQVYTLWVDHREAEGRDFWFLVTRARDETEAREQFNKVYLPGGDTSDSRFWAHFSMVLNLRLGVHAVGPLAGMYPVPCQAELHWHGE